MGISVRKNSLPYVQPYSVVNDGEDVLGNYKSLKRAKEAAVAFQELADAGIKAAEATIELNKSMTGLEAMEKRMNKPDGDSVPKKRIRRVIIDD